MLKKVTVAIALTGLMAGMAYAGSAPGTGINGSMHDINTWKTTTAGASATADSLSRSCVFCHTPHNAVSAAGPLWNRTVATTALAVYQWVEPKNSSLGASDPTVGPTRLCMTCHDGSLAPDAHGSTGGTGSMPANAKLSDLAKTHPIGFDYLAAATTRGATEIVPATRGFITGDTVGNFLSTGTRTVTVATKPISEALYFEAGNTTVGKMTCATCHDVHNTYVTGTSFLRAKEEGSAICLSCHVK